MLSKGPKTIPIVKINVYFSNISIITQYNFQHEIYNRDGKRESLQEDIENSILNVRVGDFSASRHRY